MATRNSRPSFIDFFSLPFLCEHTVAGISLGFGLAGLFSVAICIDRDYLAPTNCPGWTNSLEIPGSIFGRCIRSDGLLACTDFLDPLVVDETIERATDFCPESRLITLLGGRNANCIWNSRT